LIIFVIDQHQFNTQLAQLHPSNADGTHCAIGKLVMLLKIVVLAVLVLIIGMGALFGYGSMQWNTETQSIRYRLESERQSIQSKTFDPKELAGLPAPVQRYFQTVLTPGQQIVTAVDIDQVGTFNMSETGDKWSPFTAKQRVIAQRAGFDWDASIRMFPGVHVRVHDAYVAGEGILHAALLGAVTLANMRGKPDAAQGEFMRFVAEAAWYPTQMLPSQGATWQAVDDTSAKLTMRDGTSTVTLLVSFGTDQLIRTTKADARSRMMAGKMVTVPWQGRFWDYRLQDGMRIPQQAEAEWLMPDGPKPYFLGQTTSLRYEFN
jgi:hypothetical protein